MKTKISILITFKSDKIIYNYTYKSTIMDQNIHKKLYNARNTIIEMFT